MRTLNQKLHEVRLRNMELRSGQSAYIAKIDRLLSENRKLQAKVLELDKKSAVDCDTILNQVKELEDLEALNKQAKDRQKKTEQKLRQASKLF